MDTNDRARAACRDADPELFYPTAARGQAKTQQIADAKAVCVFCPVRPACLRWALEVRDDHAVLGGTTATERREMLREARQQRDAALVASLSAS